MKKLTASAFKKQKGLWESAHALSRAVDSGVPDKIAKALEAVDKEGDYGAITDYAEYIRKIAQGQFTDAYMLNRESNVFPGILGRVCDRPCDPACPRLPASSYGKP